MFHKQVSSHVAGIAEILCTFGVDTIHSVCTNHRRGTILVYLLLLFLVYLVYLLLFLVYLLLFLVYFCYLA